MINAIILLIVMLLLLAGSIWLQIFLSKKNNKWLGLIIPTAFFLLSISVVFSLTMYTTSAGTVTVTETVNGDVIRVIEEPATIESDKPNLLAMIATALPFFLILNIPTLISLAIYFTYRERRKIKAQLDKMNVQDLE